ncbi:MAG: Holliday junction branch migration DNA helicase RuvB [Patescibacteria group bacterium]|jgi:Holliday junction DNA helicase RuvB
MENRIIDPKVQLGDDELDTHLRPRSFDGYVGQTQIKAGLEIAIAAAKQTGDSLDHILLFGPPGLGKTTLASIIANEVGVNLRPTSGPAIERAGDLAAILTNLQEGDILFIDEIHALSRNVEEVLYSAMEDFAFDIVVGKGPSARSLKLSLPRFTLIGATTRAGILSSPLRDRFGSTYRLNFYEPEEIEQILHRSARILQINLPTDCAKLIARSSRRTPRTANRILKRVREYALVKNGGQITPAVVQSALELMTIDQHGLDEVDRKILSTIINQFKGGPVGVGSIAAAIAEEVQTIEDVYEPYLLQSGFLHRTAQGRVATELAYQLLGLPVPAKPQLFS